jgi:hypothetical protein
MFIFIFLIIAAQFPAFGAATSYDLLLEKFNQAQDLIDYSDLEGRKCTSIRKTRPESFERTTITIFPGEIEIPRVEAHVIPAIPERFEYPNGPLMPPRVIPGRPETYVPFQSEVFVGKVFLEINGPRSVRRRDRAYMSEALDDKITLRSNEYGGKFDLSSWVDYNSETILKKSGNYIFFKKVHFWERKGDFDFVGYCWD